MINVPSDSGQDWDGIVKKLRDDTIRKINLILKCSITDYIEEERIVTPKIIDKKTESFMGALYGTSSNSLKSSFVRHPNFSKKYDNLFFTEKYDYPIRCNYKTKIIHTISILYVIHK